MTDSGVDSELSPSSPDSITETSTTTTTTTPSMVIQTPTNNCETVARSAEELVAKMEEEDEDEDEDECEDKIADKMETVEALLSLSEASRSPVGSPEKPLITILPAHNPDKGETLRHCQTVRGKYLFINCTVVVVVLSFTFECSVLKL